MGLDAIDIVVGLEEEFGIELSDKARELQTVGELADHISRQVRGRPLEEVWPAVQRIVAEKLNLSLDEVQPDSRWIEDLGVN